MQLTIMFFIIFFYIYKKEKGRKNIIIQQWHHTIYNHLYVCVYIIYVSMNRAHRNLDSGFTDPTRSSHDHEQDYIRVTLVIYYIYKCIIPQLMYMYLLSIHICLYKHTRKL